MNLGLKWALSGSLAVFLSLSATTAGAGPRSVKVGAGGTTTEIDSRTGKVKPRRGTSSAPAPSTSELLPLDLSDMRLWNWQGKWHASEWDHAFSDVPWRYSRITQNAAGDTFFKLDSAGAPELQAINQTAQKRGLWETDVSLPNEASGLAIAPLWLYNKDTKDEIDFEFVGTKGLQVNIHSYRSGKHVQAPVLLPSTQGWSGRRVRFGIRTDLDAGKIEMLIDGRVVHTYTRAAHPAAFPSTALKPFISMWPAKSGLGWAETWLGKWAGEPATMVVHGFGYTG